MKNVNLAVKLTIEVRTFPGLALTRNRVTVKLLRPEGLDDLPFECHEEGPDVNEFAEDNEIIRARQLLERYTKRGKDGRYEVSLLWKEDEPMLPYNRALAEDLESVET